MFKFIKDHDMNRQGRRLFPMLPLRDLVVFPQMVVPLFVGREKSILALESAMDGGGKTIFLSTQKRAQANEPSEDEIYRVGTICGILQMLKLPDGTIKVFMEGKHRGRITRFLHHPDFYMAEVDELKECEETTLEVEALIRSIKASFEQYVKLNKKIQSEVMESISSIQHGGRLADSIAAHLTLKIEDKQLLLEITSTSKRLEKLIYLLETEIEVLQIEKNIRSRVKSQMEKSQKEYYLAEQMRAIQKEMGEKDEFQNEIKELERRLKRKKMSEEAANRMTGELKKLRMMSPMSAEATVVRNYIEWFASLPWDEATEEKYDLAEAERVLEEDHYGLKKPKERILEYLAVQSLVGKLKGPILCFVGPPGVGKTSLAKSIARASGRNFVRLSLGGVRDEAEIRGHRRTYIGALPGKIIQHLKKAKSCNPVFLLDEVDKMSMDFRGDPSAALLEVLDPEQNHAFNDHYLDVDYDLSRVMFITTANTLHGIQPPLQDRMEIIRLPGYTEDEKLNIAKKFLVSKQLEFHGLAGRDIVFTDKAILNLIRQYTREAGVRNLEREIASICRKLAREFVKNDRARSIRIVPRSVQKYLGVPPYRYGKKEKRKFIGMVNGLAWTDFGGELLTTEATAMPGNGTLTITGKLGDVMQESGQAALSYVRSRAALLGLKEDFYQKLDIHIHVPEGAIPKDGPSAGITMAISIISALLKKPVRVDLAMTGEITLRGRVLPVGGLKEKILAAHRGHINTVIIPYENEKDLKEIPPAIFKGMKIVLADHMDTVLVTAMPEQSLLQSSHGEPPENRIVEGDSFLHEEEPLMDIASH
ncbi:MAG: endopeptidase La [Deltaproteobacteria bacterium]|nr:endopeptidase La [Deltaproteobacteria bacterium]